MTDIIDRISFFQYVDTDGSKFVIFTDKFGRKWKLKEVNNPAILMPFIIEPLPLFLSLSISFP